MLRGTCSDCVNPTWANYEAEIQIDGGETFISASERQRAKAFSIRPFLGAAGGNCGHRPPPMAGIAGAALYQLGPGDLAAVLSQLEPNSPHSAAAHLPTSSTPFATSASR